MRALRSGATSMEEGGGYPPKPIKKRGGGGMGRGGDINPVNGGGWQAYHRGAMQPVATRSYI